MLNYLRNEGGQFAVAFACMATLLMGVTGGAVDLIVYNNHRAQLKNTADAAVLAAAREASLRGWSVQTARQTAANVIKADIESRFSSSADFAFDVEVDQNLRRVDLKLTQDNYRYFFLGYFTGSPQITIHATASAFGQANICIEVQSDTAPQAFDLSGSAVVAANDCSIYSNSRDVKGVSAKGPALLSSDFACSAGGFSGASRNYSPLPVTDCPALEDPLLGRARAIDSSLDTSNCLAQKLDIEKTTTSLQPGTYCGDIKISGGAAVTLQPGVYVIEGKLRVDKKSSISGNGVAFVFAGDKSGLELKNDSTVSLAAPQNGLLAGMLIYVQPGEKKNRQFKIESRNAGKLIGTVYMPDDILVVGGDKDGDGKCDVDEDDASGEVPTGENCDSDVGTTSAWTAIVVEQLKVTNGAKLVLNADYASSPIPVPEGLGPTSRSIRLAR